MTVSNLNYENSYTTDGITSAYGFNFAATETGQIQVYLNGVLQNSGFTVALSLVTVGGTVTFTTAPTIGQTLLLYRSSNLLQEDTLADNQALPPATIEAMIDKLTIICQQLSAQFTQAPVASNASGITNNVNSFPGGSGNAGYIVGLDPTGELWELLNPANVFATYLPNPGKGNVIGPVSSVSGNLAAFNGITGQLLEDSGASVSSIEALITANAALFGTSNPNSSITGIQGQRYYDTTNVVEYICTANGTSNWLRLSVPTGTIASLWSTAAVPAGWVLCNGSNGTPNEIGMVEQGADITGGSSSANASGYTKITNQSTGGVTSNNLSHVHATETGGSGPPYGSIGSTQTGSALSTVSTQPAVLSIVKIMKL